MSDITSTIARVRELDRRITEERLRGSQSVHITKQLLHPLAVLLADECERLRRIVDKAAKLCNSVAELQRIVDANKGNE